MYTLKKRIRRNIISCYHALQIDKLRMCLGGFDKQINDALDKYAHNSKLSKNELKSDIKKCYYQYLTTPDEYFLFGFEGKDDAYRTSFLGDNYKVRILLKTISEKKYINELCDKYNFYTIAHRYFKRKVIKVGGNKSATKIEFIEFASKRLSAFVKPLSSTWGKGAHILNFSNIDNDELGKIYDNYTSSEWIFEDLISQCKDMALWNESSVNTVRLPCILSEGRFHILNPFLRTGRKGSVIDNAGGGGIFTCVDEKSGMIITDGIDERHNIYISHPDSGINFKGWKIPKYEELRILAEDIFRSCFSEHKYIGFDFALTDNGWVLIEGNWGQFVGQYVSKKGVKQEFIEYINL